MERVAKVTGQVLSNGRDQIAMNGQVDASERGSVTVTTGPRRPLRSDAEVQKMVHENRSLVEWSVNRYLSRHSVTGIDREDLVSWGMLGLLSAARAFDASRGLRFSTLAAIAIERSITRGALQSIGQTSRLLSLDQAIREGEAAEGETRWVELLQDEGAERELARTEDLASLTGAIDQLRPAQQRLIREHFFNGYSLADLARQWGTSRQAVAGQLRRALRALRRSMEPNPMPPLKPC